MIPKGNQISVGQREWTHLEEEGVANSMSFDFQTNWNLTLECIKEAIKKEYFGKRPALPKSIKEEYTWENAAKKTLEVYREVLKK